jgi:RimJ/RimL family protein N-acetyltransferase
MLPDIIETTRLQLRPFCLRDVDEVFVYASDPEWARYLPVPQPYTKADAEKFIAGQVLLDRAIHPAWTMADARNFGSLRVMEKLGMTCEGVLRQNRRVRGEFIDETWCGVLRSEWEAHKH